MLWVLAVWYLLLVHSIPLHEYITSLKNLLAF